MSYVEDARARAKRRKSRWNLLLIPTTLLAVAGIWAALALAAQHVHLRLYPGEDLTTGEGPWVVLAAIAPLFAAMAVGMRVANSVVRRVEPARLALEREARPDPRLGYRGTRDDLARWTWSVTAASLAVTTLGTLLPW